MKPLQTPYKLHSWAYLGSVLGLCVALVVYAPASWLAAGIDLASTGKVLLEEPRGTVWAGSAQLVLAGGNGSAGATRLPSRMSWKINPQWLGVTVLLDAPCCTPVAPVQVTALLGGVTGAGALTWLLRSPKLTFPATLLTGLGAPWNTMQLAGDFQVSSDQLAGKWISGQGLQQLTGQALLQADNVTTALSTVQPLGSYRLSTAGTSLKLETKTDSSSEAALVLSGTGQIEQGRLAFLGEALAGKGREDALSNLLHMIGQWQPSTDGRLRSVLKI
jgi:general secretion pathway protein N